MYMKNSQNTNTYQRSLSQALVANGGRSKSISSLVLASFLAIMSPMKEVKAEGDVSPRIERFCKVVQSDMRTIIDDLRDGPQ